MEAILKPEVLNVVAGISSLISLLSLLAYLYFVLVSGKKDTSILEVIKGENISNPKLILEILKQYTDDKNRLEALKTLAKYDKEQSFKILNRIKSKIDIQTFASNSGKHRERIVLITGCFFVVIAVVAFAGGKNKNTKEVKPIQDSSLIVSITYKGEPVEATVRIIELDTAISSDVHGIINFPVPPKFSEVNIFHIDVFYDGQHSLFSISPGINQDLQIQ